MSITHSSIIRILCIVLCISFPGGTARANPEEILLKQINTWESRDRLDLARQTIEKLFAISPDNPDGLAQLALIELRENEVEKAQLLLDRLINVDPEHPEVQNIQQAIQLTGPNKALLQEARMLAKSANTSVGSASGNREKSIKAYEKLFKGNVPTPQLRYEYWLVIGDSEGGWGRALEGLEKLATDYPNSLRYKLAVIEHKLSKTPGDNEQLAELRQFMDNPRYQKQASASWRRAIFRLDEKPASIPYYLEYLEYDPQDTSVTYRLEQVEKAQREYAELHKKPAFIAKLEGLEYLKKNDLEAAENSFTVALQSRPDDIDAVGGMGSIRLRQGRHDEAVTYFEKGLALALTTDPDNESKYRSLIQTATFWGLLAQANKQIEDEKLEDAEQTIKDALKIDQHPNANSALARVYVLQGKLDEGRALYETELVKNPQNSSLLHGLINSYLDAGDIAGARSILDELTNEQKQHGLGDSYKMMQSLILQTEADQLMQTEDFELALGKFEEARQYTPDDPWLLLDLARLYDKLGIPFDTVLEYFESAGKQNPESYDTFYAHGLFLNSIDDTDAALTLFTSIPQKHRSQSLQSTIDQLTVERSSMVTAGYDFITRSASDGKSSLDTSQIPMQLRLADTNNGHLFFHVEPVSLDSGAVSQDDRSSVSEFGLGLFCWPNCSGSEYDQEAKGVALAVGYERKGLRLDVGTTPLGFEVEDVVGGIKFDSTYDIFYWGIDISRRPMTGTLLTYAGTKDINTGEVWGGVRANGVTLSFGHDKGESFGFWSNLDLHSLTGENVADNSRFRLMGGAYYRVVNSDDKQLSIGFNGSLWRHEKTLDEFTFGQGGYYSPKRYESLSVPVDFSGRYSERLSYRLRASASYSWDYEEQEPFYPNNDLLQENAEALEDTTGVDPYFTGGHGSGFGYSLLAAVEYKLSRHVALGVNISTDQSDYYQPTRAVMYLRYSFDENRLQVQTPPRSVESYANF